MVAEQQYSVSRGILPLWRVGKIRRDNIGEAAAESLGATIPKFGLKVRTPLPGTRIPAAEIATRCIRGNTQRLCGISIDPKLVNEHKDRAEISRVGNRKHCEKSSKCRQPCAGVAERPAAV